MCIGWFNGLKMASNVTIPEAGCSWPGNDPIMQAYHDTEWGVPVHDDRKHFEFLVLDAAQAGLSWRTVLHKRAGYSRAFAEFDFNQVAQFTSADVDRLLLDPGIIRNRQKIQSAITNAKAMQGIIATHGSFDAFIWQFTNFQTITNHWERTAAIPATTPASEAMSKALKKLGFSFCGSTICYAYMQAAGMVNDHVLSCHRFLDLQQ